jgi:hypothetical protein
MTRLADIPKVAGFRLRLLHMALLPVSRIPAPVLLAMTAQEYDVTRVASADEISAMLWQR